MVRRPKNGPVEVDYEAELDKWVVAATESGAQDLWQLISLLPGVYPTVARQAVKRLILDGRLPAHLALEASAPRSRGASGVPGLPPTHPLAFDWRFTSETAAALLERTVSLTSPAETVALLGAPSVYLLGASQGFPRHFRLVDRNRSIVNYVPHIPPRGIVHHCDVMRDPVGLSLAQAVLADPPWYEAEALAFLRASACICALGGAILLSFPPEGVRSGVREERERVVIEAEQSGLRFIGVERLALSYTTPVFEHNALRAAGFGYVASDWRRGDILLFQKQHNAGPAEGDPTSGDNRWIEAEIQGVTIWVRRTHQRKFGDPRLLSLVSGDVLPTVSRRDGRRDAVDVWTTGNRVYACNGPEVLSTILMALQALQDPFVAVSKSYGRPLNNREATEVAASVSQVEEIVQTERQEIRRLIDGRA